MVTADGPVYKKYDVPIKRSQGSTQVAHGHEEPESQVDTHDEGFWTWPAMAPRCPLQMMIVEHCDVLSMGDHVILETFIIIGLEFGQHHGHDHHDFLHHYIHVANYYIPVCSPTDSSITGVLPVGLYTILYSVYAKRIANKPLDQKTK